MCSSDLIPAVLFYLFYKSETLIKPMVTGYRAGVHGTGSSIRQASNWLAILIVALAAVAVYFIVRK